MEFGFFYFLFFILFTLENLAKDLFCPTWLALSIFILLFTFIFSSSISY